MLKRLSLAISIACLAASPVLAQGWQDAPGNAANGQNGTAWSNSAASRQEQQFYNYQQPGGSGPGTWDARGVSQQTQKNGALGFGNSYGPMLLGGLGSSGAAQGGPVIIGGFNTKWAPQNMALQTQNHSMMGGKLPKTTLDSFVAQSGYNDHIYGDEGTDGPPPYSSFSTIGSGGVRATTGHKSDAPSAWY